MVGNTHGFKKGQPRLEGADKPSQQIEVFDLQEKTTTSYNSMSEAARTLDIRWKYIKNYFVCNQQKPYKDRYTFNKIRFYLRSIIILVSTSCAFHLLLR